MANKNPVGILCNRVFYCLIFFYLTLNTSVFATPITPFTTRDQNPLVSLYGLPLPVSARLLQPQQSALHISGNFSNTINREQTNNELFFIDIETHKINFIYDTAIQKDWMLRLQIPLIKHYEGFMDKWIDDYHQLLNLPEGIRPSNPRNQISLYYERNGTAAIDLQQAQTGSGDLSLQLAYQSINRNNFSLSYWSGLKLPTGNSDKLTGSGSIDMAFWLAGQIQLENTLWAYANAGMVFMGNSNILAGIQKDHAQFLTTGIQFNASENILLKLQLDTHSAFYNSNIEFLGPVIQLTFGGSIIIDSNSEFDIAVAEDIQEEASPDLNFNLTWRRYF